MHALQVRVNHLRQQTAVPSSVPPRVTRNTRSRGERRKWGSVARGQSHPLSGDRASQRALSISHNERSSMARMRACALRGGERPAQPTKKSKQDQSGGRMRHHAIPERDEVRALAQRAVFQTVLRTVSSAHGHWLAAVFIRFPRVRRGSNRPTCCVPLRIANVTGRAARNLYNVYACEHAR